MSRPSASTRPAMFRILAPIAALTGLSCAEIQPEEPLDTIPPTESTRPEGWTDQTHGKDADPDYQTVFPDGQVNRIDITIDADDWQIMQDDLLEMLGEPGSISTEIPEELFDACVDLREDDPCEAYGGAVVGTCVSVMGSDLACLSEEMLDQIPQFDGNLDLVPDKPVYQPCTVSFQGTCWEHVGLRFKGNSTLAYAWAMGSQKLPLRLDFDEFEDEFPEIDDQRFHGFKWLSMANNFNDPTYLRERVGADLLRDAGVPSPHTAFYRVFIDYGQGPDYFGLYTAAEIPHDPMLEAQFGGDDGTLYKASGDGATWAIFDTDAFEQKTNGSDGDFGDLERLFDAVHGTQEDPGSWRAELESAFDVQGFLTWLATNTVMQNWDSYGNTPQNYYLYSDPLEGDRVAWIAWDFNESLKPEGSLMEPLTLGLEEVGEDWPLIRYLLDDEEYHERYLSKVEATLEVFSTAELQQRFRSEHELIEPYVFGDEGELPEYTFLTDSEDFDLDLEELCLYVEERVVETQQFLDDSR